MLGKFVPEVAEFEKWHLCSSDGPMHYPANAVYFAGNRDHNGRAAGEAKSWVYGVRFNGVPVTIRIRHNLYEFLQSRIGTGEFQVYPIAHENRKGETFDFKPKYNLVGFPAEKWHECPFDDKTEAEEFCAALNTCTVEFVKVPTSWSKGKARELAFARSSAIWLEATDEELSVDRDALRKVLEARLPKLMDEFHAFVVGLGFTF